MSGEEWLSIVMAIVGGGGIGGGLTAWWQIKKLKGETTKVEIDAAIAVDSAEDKHLLAIIENQAQHLITPLRDEVGRLRLEVNDLSKALRDQQNRFWRWVSWGRDMVVWARLWHGDEEGKPPYPPPPEDVVNLDY